MEFKTPKRSKEKIMKRKLQQTLTTLLLLTVMPLTAQVLWSDDFNSYTVGNLGTIHSLLGQSNLSPTPAVAGQGGMVCNRIIQRCWFLYQ